MNRLNKIPAIEPDLIEAYLRADGPEVFDTIVGKGQVWTADPYDVETVHPEARRQFDRLLSHHAKSAGPGRAWVVRGGAGTGKTHLMRACRTRCHADGSAYFAYMHMTSETVSYPRYLLGNIIESLDKPYSAASSVTGLKRLARGLVDLIPGVDPALRIRYIGGARAEPGAIAALVECWVDILIQTQRFCHLDPEVLRVFCMLARNDGMLSFHCIRWLRGEKLTAAGQTLLGDLPSRFDDDPLRLIASLGALAITVHDTPLILCIDQIEDVYDKTTGTPQFRKLVDALFAIIEAVPRSVVILSCLDDLYLEAIKQLDQPKLDRLNAIKPAQLAEGLPIEGLQAVVAKRLAEYFAFIEPPPERTHPLAPYRLSDLEPFVGLPLRRALDQLRHHRQASIEARQWLPVAKLVADDTIKTQMIAIDSTWPRRWNDFHSAFEAHALPPASKASLLAAVIRLLNHELPEGQRFLPTNPDGNAILVQCLIANRVEDQFYIGICEKNPAGGGLLNEVNTLSNQAGKHRAVVVRTGQFTVGANTKISLVLGTLIAKFHWRRQVVSASDWRLWEAFHQFEKTHADEPGFAHWCKGEAVLAGSILREILALSNLRSIAAVPVPVESPAVEVPNSQVRLGVSRLAEASPVVLPFKALTHHLAILGSTGSGKTTLALNIVEQLLANGVPVILLDRKGDLGQYANPAAWERSLDAESSARRDQLRQQIEVRLYTPGLVAGNSPRLPLLPPDFATMPQADRDAVAGRTRSALCGMMRIGDTQASQPQQAILLEAVKLLALAQPTDDPVGLLQQWVNTQDPALIGEVGGFDAKNYRTLGQALLALKVNRGSLLSGPGPELSIDELLGREPSAKPNMTRLSVICTRSLADEEAMFWVAQLLMQIERYFQRHPANQLQAVLMLDEADIYAPDNAKPATRPILDSMSKKMRSAGLGLILATQSPGDLDYKLRDQLGSKLVGRIAETTAVNKLKTMFTNAPQVADQLGGQKQGEFFLFGDELPIPFHADASFIQTAQLSDQEIARLARREST